MIGDPNFDAMMKRLKLMRDVNRMQGVTPASYDLIPSGQVERFPVGASRGNTKILKGGSAGNIVPVSIGQFAQLVAVAGPDDEAQVMGVTLIPPLIPGGFGNFAVSTGHESAFAVVQWGVAGGVCTAEVDYGRGGSFSLVASSVRIMVGRETDPGGFVPIPVLFFGASVCKNPIASPMKMTRTLNSFDAFPGGMLPGNASSITIPPYAKSVTCYSAASALPIGTGQLPMSIGILNFFGTSLGDIQTGLNQLPVNILLPNKASLLVVQNTGLVNAHQQYVFELAL